MGAVTIGLASGMVGGGPPPWGRGAAFREEVTELGGALTSGGSNLAGGGTFLKEEAGVGGRGSSLPSLLSEGLTPAPAFDTGVLPKVGGGLGREPITGDFGNGVVVATALAGTLRGVVGGSRDWTPKSSLPGVPTGPAPFDLDFGGIGGLWGGFWDTTIGSIPWAGVKILTGVGGGPWGVSESKV